jgi:hypothetical protein
MILVEDMILKARMIEIPVVGVAKIKSLLKQNQLVLIVNEYFVVVEHVDVIECNMLVNPKIFVILSLLYTNHVKTNPILR